MTKVKYSINVIFAALFLLSAGFAFLNICFAAAGAVVEYKFEEVDYKMKGRSGFYNPVNNLKYIPLIDNKSDICFQLIFSGEQKRMLNVISKRIIDDRFFVESVAELKEIFENSIIRFFLKTAFESILKDLSAVSFSYSAIKNDEGNKGEKSGKNNKSYKHDKNAGNVAVAGGVKDSGGSKNNSAEYINSLIFTFDGPDAPAHIYETRADLFEMLNYNDKSSIEVKIIEEDKGGAKTAYAVINGKTCNLAIFTMNNHIAFFYSSRCEPKDFTIISEMTAASIKKFDSGEKCVKFSYDNNLKDFKKDNNFLLNIDLTNLAIEDSAAAELVKSVFIGAKFDDDYSNISFDSYIEFRDAGRNASGDNKGDFAAGSSLDVERKTLNALKLLFKPLKNASSAMDYLPADTSFLTEFNLNFNDEFLAITDVFVFRGLLLTAAGIDYKDDFLLWFDGGLFFATGGLNIDAEAVINEKPIEMPEIYIGLKLKKPVLANGGGDTSEVSPSDKFADKIIELISDSFSPVEVDTVSDGLIRARRVELPALPYFTTGEIVFGIAGDYYLITSSKAAFEKIAGAAGKKSDDAVKKLSAVIDSKNLNVPVNGRFFNFYLNYKALRVIFDKFIKFMPSFKTAAALPVDYCLSAAFIVDNGGIESSALISLDKLMFYSIIEKIDINQIINYLEMLDNLSRQD